LIPVSKVIYWPNSKIMVFKTLSKSFAFFYCFALIHFGYGQTLVTSPPEDAGLSTERLSRLTKTFQTYVANDELSGAVILIMRKGKVPYFEAFGKSDVENNVPMKKDAIFRIASQTKALVSVGIMLLEEEGKLLINEPVGNYIPAFKETTVAVPTDDDNYTIEKAKRAITIRHLLTHTAGIGYGEGVAKDLWKEAGIQGWYFADREEPILTTVERMAKLPFDAHPGEKWVYGYNTDILGALIEVVSGKPLDVFLKERIFEPLGMMDTHFYLPEEKADRLAVVYSASEEGIERSPDPGHMEGQGHYVKGPRKSYSGGAGCLSTATDYAKFLAMMLNMGKYNEGRLLSRKSVELMTTSNISTEIYPWGKATGFGLGFGVLDHLGLRGKVGSEGEYGWGGAYHSVYWVDPKEELVVVYFTQLIPTNGLDDHEKLRTLVYQSIID